ncbi:F0F1 ATP synthase subunit gamma [Candidatus Babeliales bacterium]|nr:F0F1 ATP synthase subunit gamma [Candidatus Babeliales bacterium]MBP9843645.1 F0F1 ATP synthase subunit gamma [Candidatus Babeliales bacterium]
MSQLIQIKQRIKAIQVIKKITHAMRLISMSSRIKMIKHSENLQFFRDEITPLLCSLEKVHPNIDENQRFAKNIWILIASEKGLCGNFNNVIFNYFQSKLKTIDQADYNFIAVGKQAGDFLAQQGIKVIARYDKLSPNQLEKTATHLYEFLLQHKSSYQTVTCFYNQSKTFFIQEPCKYQLLPVQAQKSCSITDNVNLEDYHWAQSPAHVLECIFQSFLKLNVLYILSQSMIAEQSSRFLSMDSSTRNAENLLKKMNLEYNKIRQAKITRELTELISSF